MLCQQYRLPGGAKMEDRIMKKLGMLGIIGGAAILTAVPLSLQLSQKNVALSLASAEAQERPLTATSVAGVSRRAYRRAYRSAAYARRRSKRPPPTTTGRSCKSDWPSSPVASR